MNASCLKSGNGDYADYEVASDITCLRQSFRGEIPASASASASASWRVLMTCSSENRFFMVSHHVTDEDMTSTVVCYLTTSRSNKRSAAAL